MAGDYNKDISDNLTAQGNDKPQSTNALSLWLYRHFDCNTGYTSTCKDANREHNIGRSYAVGDSDVFSGHVHGRLMLLPIFSMRLSPVELPLSVAASSCNTHTQGTKASISIRLPTNICYALTVHSSGKVCGLQMVTTLNSCHYCTRPVCFQTHG